MYKSRKHAKKSNDDSGGQNDDDEDDKKEKNNYTTVKCGLRGILRPKYREMFVQYIEAKSIMSTRICALASLLFLFKVQTAYDKGRIHRDFFEQNGHIVIKECFEAVLVQNVDSSKMPQEFCEIADNLDELHRFQWPNNKTFGNAFKELIKTYQTNVTTNLKTHCKQRLVNYLKMKVFQCNTQLPVVYRYTPKDIANAVDFLIFKKDIEASSNEMEIIRLRRDMLIQMVRNISWFDIDDEQLFGSMKNWFKSIPMWIGMQREIDEYNSRRSNEHNASSNRKQKKPKKKPRRWQPREKQMLNNPRNPPQIKNLAVIPICDFKRTHFTIDNDVLYRLLSTNKLLMKIGNANIKTGQFNAQKYMHWNKYFYMRKIQWFVRRKKAFDFRIRSDGVSVSLQYISPHSEPGTIDLKKVKAKYRNHVIKNAVGLDPGENKWASVVQRNIETGAEV